MKKQLKILSLIDIPWNSGLTDYAIKQAKALELKGHKIFFAAQKDTLCYKALTKEGFKTINITGRKNNFIINDVLKISNFVKKEKIDLIIAHTGRTQTIAILSSLISKVKVIRTKADVSISRKNIFTNSLSKIICASNFIKENCLKGNFSKEKISVILPPAPEFNIKTAGFPKDNYFKIGILARLSPVKGHKYFLETAKILLDKGLNLQFIIGGYETNNLKYSDLTNYSAELGILEKIKFEGKIDNPENFIQNCHIGVITSTGSEAVSRVLLEWMSAGRPVIATSVGCIPEILDKEYIVPPKGPQAMAEKLEKLIFSETEYFKAANKNKEIIEKKYNMNLFSENTEKEVLKIFND